MLELIKDSTKYLTILNNSLQHTDLKSIKIVNNSLFQLKIFYDGFIPKVRGGLKFGQIIIIKQQFTSGDQKLLKNIFLAAS